MHPGAHFVGEYFVDFSLARNPTHVRECRRDDAHTKMRLAARSGARMSGMARTLILHFDFGGTKGFNQLPADVVGNTHAVSIARRAEKSSTTFSCFFIHPYHNRTMSTADYRPRFGKDIRIKPDAPMRAPATRSCAATGCAGEGAFRVPKARDHLDVHLWFCLEHARRHNEHWDYFSGMSQADIEAFAEDALTGHRPTWPLGKRAAQGHAARDQRKFRDFHSVFNGPGGDADGTAAPRPPLRTLTPLQALAFDVLNLESDASLHQIKARYKELVKRFHPDANGGDRGTEERLKRVIQAYGVLRASGLT